MDSIVRWNFHEFRYDNNHHAKTQSRKEFK
jgi:hypothetical protein